MKTEADSSLPCRSSRGAQPSTQRPLGTEAHLCSSWSVSSTLLIKDCPSEELYTCTGKSRPCALRRLKPRCTDTTKAQTSLDASDVDGSRATQASQQRRSFCTHTRPEAGSPPTRAKPGSLRACPRPLHCVPAPSPTVLPTLPALLPERPGLQPRLPVHPRPAATGATSPCTPCNWRGFPCTSRGPHRSHRMADCPVQSQGQGMPASPAPSPRLGPTHTEAFSQG